MSVNKVIFSGETLIDLTGDSVATDTVVNGVTFHDATGTQKTGTLKPITVHSGTSTAMTASVGSDGDIYLVTE